MFRPPAASIGSRRPSCASSAESDAGGHNQAAELAVRNLPRRSGAAAAVQNPIVAAASPIQATNQREDVSEPCAASSSRSTRSRQ